MQGELVITERDLRSRFQGEHDLVTLAPYEVGDRVVRCSNCHAIVKSEFVSTGSCPICGHTPFNSAPVISTSEVTTRYSIRYRGFREYAWLLLISAFVSLMPFLFPNARYFLLEATFGLDIVWLITIALSLSSIAAIILGCNTKCRHAWRSSKSGWLIPFIPSIVPYSVLLAVWTTIVVVQIIVAVLIIGIVIAFLVGLCGGGSQ